jgi:hypothetical protein
MSADGENPGGGASRCAELAAEVTDPKLKKRFTDLAGQRTGPSIRLEKAGELDGWWPTKKG